MIIDSIITDHNNETLSIIYDGQEVNYDYQQREDFMNWVNSYYYTCYHIKDFTILREKLKRFEN